MERVRAEQERLEKGFCTFENAWVAYKPGITHVYRSIDSSWRAFVVDNISGGIYCKPTQPWVVTGWSLQFDGIFLGRHLWGMTIPESDGQVPVKGYFISDRANIQGEGVERLISDGRMYYDLLTRHFWHHKGKSSVFPYNKVSLSLSIFGFLLPSPRWTVRSFMFLISRQLDSLVMADLWTYYAGPHSRPSLMKDDDCRVWYSDCTCRICQERAIEGRGNVKSIFRVYNRIVPTKDDELTRHEYLLCPGQIFAYVFKLRTWGMSVATFIQEIKCTNTLGSEKLHVTNFFPPEFQDGMIDGLVMDQNRIKILKALAQSYIRVNKHGNHIGNEQWAADFVKGKGNGLTFLLHGRPGVGKTVTAGT